MILKNRDIVAYHPDIKECALVSTTLPAHVIDYMRRMADQNQLGRLALGHPPVLTVFDDPNPDDGCSW